MPADPEAGLAIGEVAARTGFSVATLRSWERRHGFPRPRRPGGGHRRYSEQDVARLERVGDERRRGLSVAAAIARATSLADELPQSLFAMLRTLRPDLVPRRMRKSDLVRLSRAIEDESCARAERPFLFGGFQSARFYRRSEPRWRDLARTAQATVVYADFRRARLARGAPIELPVSRSQPLSREWAVVCDAPAHAACLAAWELPGQAGTADRDRLYEAVWSIEPDVVRDSARIASELARERFPDLATELLAALDARPLAPVDTQLRLACAITARALSAAVAPAASNSVIGGLRFRGR